jgi:hypothetical protein
MCQSLTGLVLFQSNKPWRERLTGLALAKIRQAALTGQYAVDKLDEGAIAKAVSDPKRWSLQSSGLFLVFQQYELGLGYAFNPNVVIPWPDLQDVMVSDPPVP